jgi:spore coat protein H
MKTIFRGILAFVAGVFVLLLSMQSLTSSEMIDERLNVATLVATPDNAVQIEAPVSIDDIPFQDNMDIYLNDDPGSIVTMFVTVRKGNSSDNTDHTWYEVNNFSKFVNRVIVTRIVDKAEAIVQIGDDKGPLPGELGYADVIPNATIQIRGQSTTLSAQKSYKIELRDRAGNWRRQKTIALNKHPFDETRIKNKLCFDLMKEIPNLVSLRTQFVHLYVKDETTDPPETSFVDYGLYTQVEQPNRAFLRNHLLDAEGQLYKASSFEFFRYTEEIKPADDPSYDEFAFEAILEIKGSRDHSKLINMLDDVNNFALPIESVFEEHFNADNYFTWMAFNILIGNEDILTQDYLLYSPKNSQTWYFVPWDYDGALHRPDPSPNHYWTEGISTYWGVVLHRRVLTVEEYRQSLDKKINELREFLTTERISEMIGVYREATDKYVLGMPDILYLGETPDDYDRLVSTLPNNIDINYDLYLESLNKPMPFFLGTPEAFGDDLIFGWGEAYDFDAQNINYRFILSTDWEFNEILYDQNTNLTEIKIPKLDEGTYFWRVIASNEDGYIQYPFDHYRDAESNSQSGMKSLYITQAGEVLEE